MESLVHHPHYQGTVQNVMFHGEWGRGGVANFFASSGKKKFLLKKSKFFQNVLKKYETSVAEFWPVVGYHIFYLRKSQKVAPYRIWSRLVHPTTMKHHIQPPAQYHQIKSVHHRYLLASLPRPLTQ